MSTEKLIDELTKENEELKRRVEALAAENDRLDTFIKVECWTIDDIEDSYVDASDTMPETPATDAALAEIRAQGVDGAIETIMVHMNHQHVAVKEALHILKMYSNQLRKEAGK